jgi:hypothetical protein
MPARRYAGRLARVTEQASTRIPAIPTEYKGIAFRSLLEARWAIAFDLMGIEWAYEPLTLGEDPGTGYIADYVLQACVFSRPQVRGPTLVEVRPIYSPEQFREPINKIARSGWRGCAVVLGAITWTSDTVWGRETVLGRGHPAVSAKHADADSNEWFPVGFHSDRKVFGMGGDDLERLFREATRRSQWMPSR